MCGLSLKERWQAHQCNTKKKEEREFFMEWFNSWGQSCGSQRAATLIGQGNRPKGVQVA